MSFVVALLLITQLTLLVIALVVLLRTPVDRLRHAGRPVWLIVILFLSFIGPLAFLFLGRRRAEPTEPAEPPTADPAGLLRELYGRRVP